MKTVLRITLLVLVGAFLFGFVGCGKSVDENKPVSEIKAESEQMNVAALRDMAMAYKEKIVAQKDEIEKIAAKVKEIPIANMLDEEAKKLQTDIKNLNASISNLKERFGIYYNKLKEKNGDLSGLSL